MGKCQKRAKRRRKKQKPESIVVLILMGIVVLCLLAYTHFVVFLWCIGVLVVLLTAYFTISISKHATQGTTDDPSGIVRDRRYISPRLRQAVWTRCGGRCVECQCQSLLEYDHIIPLSRGGATSYENLQILCRACNRRKSDHI